LGRRTTRRESLLERRGEFAGEGRTVGNLPGRRPLAWRQPSGSQGSRRERLGVDSHARSGRVWFRLPRDPRWQLVQRRSSVGIRSGSRSECSGRSKQPPGVSLCREHSVRRILCDPHPAMGRTSPRPLVIGARAPRRGATGLLAKEAPTTPTPPTCWYLSSGPAPTSWPRFWSVARGPRLPLPGPAVQVEPAPGMGDEAGLASGAVWSGRSSRRPVRAKRGEVRGLERRMRPSPRGPHLASCQLVQRRCDC
jgi:hypothetical protein